jgi:hypothetical protein
MIIKPGLTLPCRGALLTCEKGPWLCCHFQDNCRRFPIGSDRFWDMAYCKMTSDKWAHHCSARSHWLDWLTPRANRTVNGCVGAARCVRLTAESHLTQAYRDTRGLPSSLTLQINMLFHSSPRPAGAGIVQSASSFNGARRGFDSQRPMKFLSLPIQSGNIPLGRPRRRWIDSIKMDLLETWWSVVDWICLARDRYRWESSCERGNEPSGSIKCWETTEWLHNFWPLERYSAPQS